MYIIFRANFTHVYFAPSLLYMQSVFRVFKKINSLCSMVCKKGNITPAPVILLMPYVDKSCGDVSRWTVRASLSIKINAGG